MKASPSAAQLRAFLDLYAPSQLDAADKARLGKGLVPLLAKDVPLDLPALAGIPADQQAYYAALKKLQADATGRKPSEIREARVAADGIAVTDPVTGKTETSNHSLFYQRWDPPLGTAAKDITIISPAYQATGRWWSPIADAASRKGSVALAMDHGFAGLSAGKAGRFDGPTLAAETAVMLREAKKLGGDQPVRLAGESLGAAAVLCGAVLAYNGKTSIPQNELPQGDVYLALVNPYLGKFSQPGASLLGRVLKHLPFTLAAKEHLTDVVKDEATEKRFDQMTQLEDVRVHPSGLAAAEDLIQHVVKGLEDGTLKLPPNLKVGFLLSRDDASIDRHETERLINALGSHVHTLKVIEGRDHAVVLNPKVQPQIAELVSAPLDSKGVIDAYTAERPAGLSFTEDMHGVLKSTIPGVQPKKVTFRVTIDTKDVKAMLSDPEHTANITGKVNIFGEQCEITHGEFDLFAVNKDTGIVEMRYRLKLATADGTPYYLEGTKYVHDDPGFDLWSDTTTLFTTVKKGDENGPILLAGKLRLNAFDLAKQLTTFRADGDTFMNKLKAFERFFGFFGKTLVHTHVETKL